MLRALGLILVLLFAAVPRDAHSSARELAGECQALLRGKRGSGEEIRIPLTKPALECWGYMQAVQDFAALADENGRRVLGICPPDRASLLDLVQAFVGHARRQGKDLPDNAALAVTQALQSAYPCAPVATVKPPPL
jgi:Ssp1 endopeptidase immunity protein Rap1a